MMSFVNVLVAAELAGAGAAGAFGPAFGWAISCVFFWANVRAFARICVRFFFLAECACVRTHSRTRTHTY